MKPDRCLAINAAGNPCGAKARPGSTWCPWHDPETRDQHRQWSKMGGEQRSNANRARKKLTGDLRDLLGVKAMLLDAMEQTKNGDMEPGVLTALSTAARAVVTVSGVADFEQVLDQMRQDMAALRSA